MKTFVCETKNNLSDKKKGPIDEKTGWPKIHKDFLVEAESLNDAKLEFEKRFPGNVLAVYEDTF